ncbi:MAG: proprotein convertase P-domain-containing protein [Deltaproteobacteria bacterium]|nr:proprotein convertase P-domain-containing protein [Deltaproteobacteria bacterium]
MNRSTFTLAAVAVAALLSPACLADDKGPEDEVPADGKADSQQRPTDHGDLAFATPVIETLTSGARFHAWEFELSGDAQVDAFTTYAVRGQRKVDTVLYLYKQGPTGWGSYMARNDDDGDRVYSRLVRSLGAGRYRVLVKGYAASTRGKFGLQIDCTGAGCASAATDRCNFASTYPDVRVDPAFAVSPDRYIASASDLDARELAQAAAALREVYGADAPDFATGFALIDRGSLRFTTLFHQPTNTDLVAVEFGAGDTSVGTIFYGTSLQVAARISDGAIEACGFFAARGLGQATAGAACRATADCATGLRCEGVFANAGTCVATGAIAGDGTECTTDASCSSAALVCAGASRGYGLCRPAWMRGAFADAATTAIPDGGSIDRAIAVRGLATVDTDVVIALTIDHPRGSQLRVTLTNPAGTEAVVHDGVAADDGHALVLDGPVSGFSGDEMVNGEWTLRVTDRATGQVGAIRGWQLVVTSRYD